MRTTASGRGRGTSGLQILEEKTNKECYKRQNQNQQRKDLFNLTAATYKKHLESKISKVTRFQVWDQALITRSVNYCTEVIKETCIWISAWAVIEDHFQGKQRQRRQSEHRSGKTNL